MARNHCPICKSPLAYAGGKYTCNVCQQEVMNPVDATSSDVIGQKDEELRGLREQVGLRDKQIADLTANEDGIKAQVATVSEERDLARHQLLAANTDLADARKQIADLTAQLDAIPPSAKKGK